MRRGVVFVAAVSVCLVCAAGEWVLTRSMPEPAVASVPPVPSYWFRGEADTNSVDLLFVFDASSRRWLDSRGLSPKGYAESCVADLNRSLAFTGIDRYFSFRLVGAIDVSPEDMSTCGLREIVASFTFAIAGRTLPRDLVGRISLDRDESRADLVAIVTAGQESGIYGHAESLREEDLAEGGFRHASENAYCACAIDTLDARHTLLHEIGHLFGAGHSDTQLRAPGPQLFPYSAAYRFSAGGTPLTTVTGYPEERGGVILPFFSSPDYVLSWSADDGTVYGGLAVGTATNDNTRTLVATFPLVAQYRVARPTESAARFERELAFALLENGQFAGEGGEIGLRCGVARTFLASVAVTGVSVRVSGLPPGFVYDGKVGTVSGIATKSGSYTALFVMDCPGVAQVRRRVVFSVSPLPDWAFGDFTTEDRNRRIVISPAGRVRIYEQRAYRVGKASQAGFVREEADSNGNPVFVLEDGKKLSLAMDGEKIYGAIGGIDGTVYRPEKKPIRKTSVRRRGNMSTPNPQSNKEKTP